MFFRPLLVSAVAGHEKGPIAARFHVARGRFCGAEKVEFFFEEIKKTMASEKNINASQKNDFLTFRRIARTLEAASPLAIVRTVRLLTSTRRASGGLCRRARGAPGKSGNMRRKGRSAAADSAAADEGQEQSSLAVSPTLPTSTRRASSSRDSD